VRTIILVAATVAIAAQVGPALGAAGHSTTLRVTSLRVQYGHPVTITGRLRSHLPGQRVEIVSHRYGGTTMHVLSIASHAGGYWSYSARPAIQTTYRAQVGTTPSRTVTIGVQPAVTVHELGHGRLAVSVHPARNFAGRMIKLQRLVRGGAWKTMSQERLGAGSSVVFMPSIPSSTIRVAMSVNQAGPGYLGGASHALRYHAYALSIVPSGYRISFGSPLSLSGRLTSAGAGQTITIYQQPFKRSSPFKVATVHTRADGTWSYRIKPVVQVSFFARWGRVESRRVRVGVSPLITTRVSPSGRIHAHVSAAVGFKGRRVKLQHLVAPNTWRTLEQMPLDYRSNVVFAPQSTGGVLRVAMSVNQAGVGYLGSLGKPFTYRAI
jgi:hypothetical protein